MKKAKPSQHFSARFAGKEAIIKALSNYDIFIPHNQIEIVHTKNGIPHVNLLHEEGDQFEIKISLSHSNEIAFAFSIISKKE
jgi:holo-[acyl-carrier protein] synthase